jgi:hypothetical protein
MPDSRLLARSTVGELATISIALVGKRFQCTIVDTEDRGSAPPQRRYRGRTLDDLVAIVLSEERRYAHQYAHSHDAFLQAIREAIYDAQDRVDSEPTLSAS